MVVGHTSNCQIYEGKPVRHRLGKGMQRTLCPLKFWHPREETNVSSWADWWMDELKEWTANPRFFGGAWKFHEHAIEYPISMYIYFFYTYNIHLVNTFVLFLDTLECWGFPGDTHGWWYAGHGKGVGGCGVVIMFLELVHMVDAVLV